MDSNILLSNIIDFCSLIVSLVGLTMAFSAFKMQIETFKSQQEVTKLEIQKFLYTIRPRFEIESKTTGVAIENSNLHGFSLRLILTNNSVQDFYCVNNTDVLKHQVDIIKRTNSPIGTTIRVYNVQKRGFEVVKNFDIDIFFSDDIGTRYYQKISGSLPLPEISPPFFVKNHENHKPLIN